MSKVHIKFDEEHFVIIDLFDNVGSNIVRNALEKISNNKPLSDIAYKKYLKTLRYLYCKDCFFCPKLNPYAIDLTGKSEELYSYFEEIKALGFNVPFIVTKTPTQRDLNTYHRFFTYNDNWVNYHHYRKTTLINQYDKKFSYSQGMYDTFSNIVHNINLIVHDIESALPTKQRTFLRNNDLNFQYFDFRFSNSDPKKRFIPIDDHLTQTSYRKNYANVILAEEITGKSYLRAFVDDDDPTASDVSGHIVSAAGFNIDVTETRRNIYETHEFRKWLDFYKLDINDIPLEYPIGNVVEASFPIKLTNNFLANLQIQ